MICNNFFTSSFLICLFLWHFLQENRSTTTTTREERRRTITEKNAIKLWFEGKSERMVRNCKKNKKKYHISLILIGEPWRTLEEKPLIVRSCIVNLNPTLDCILSFYILYPLFHIKKIHFSISTLVRFHLIQQQQQQ